MEWKRERIVIHTLGCEMISLNVCGLTHAIARHDEIKFD
jgi:hypothetical protein